MTTPPKPMELKSISGKLIGAKHYLLELIYCQKEERLGEHVLNDKQRGWMMEMQRAGLVREESMSRSQAGIIHSLHSYWMMTDLGLAVFEEYNEYRHKAAPLSDHSELIKKLADCLTSITKNTQSFLSETEELVNDSDYDRNGCLANAAAELRVNDIPTAKLLLGLIAKHGERE